ncbi:MULTISPECIES: DUF2200 domain-containing protein [unclassified Luteococcus]|uniref:DUF2200 domain-containing protein n=1 Tax=unclassified Luteococcus TaxID=2639923 RepID=UPI00313C1F3D
MSDEMTPRWCKVFAMPYAEIHAQYVNKVQSKGRTLDELEEVVEWLTGYDHDALASALDERRSMADFFAQAPGWNPSAELITGSICGYKVQEIRDPQVKQARQLDKLVDELAKGKAMEKIKRA